MLLLGQPNSKDVDIYHERILCTDVPNCVPQSPNNTELYVHQTLSYTLILLRHL